MIKRESHDVIIELSRSFPVVTITGPRQSGKTTLAKMAFPEKEYVAMENPGIREYAENDPIGFLNQYPEGAILDEIQRVPDLLSYIQVIVDEKQINGFYILTGSNQFEYIKSISQSLAGRTGILKLLPFSFNEIYTNRETVVDEILYTGYYPRIFDQKIKPVHFYTSYLMTYLERDIRNIIRVHDLSLFQKFVELCAGRTGQVLNKNSLANECGISNKTIEEWLSVLEASFIIFRLRPYHNNWNKRIVKSPKLYFLDTGLVSYLLRIESAQQIKNHPLRGEIFETFIVNEFLKRRLHFGNRENIYYFRDNNNNEVDLVIDTGYGPVPVEIKSGQTINNNFFKGLDYFSRLQKKYIRAGLVIGRDVYERRSDYLVGGYPDVYRLYDELVEEGNFV
ncbi:MAG TPA: ATP-binding protein [Spirochaetes bacterium]|nr:ATP-binding protein [Spirochaetota bacterium]